MGNTQWCHLSSLLTLCQRRQHVAVTKSATYFGSCYAEDLDMLVLLLLLQLLLLLFVSVAVPKFSGTVSANSEGNGGRAIAVTTVINMLRSARRRREFVYQIKPPSHNI